MSTQNTQVFTLEELLKRAQRGTVVDVDFLMAALSSDWSFLGFKKVDYALGQVSNPDGRARIEHFLFHGTEVQRNYAALYAKRRGLIELLDAAVARGCIDETQAYAR